MEVEIQKVNGEGNFNQDFDKLVVFYLKTVLNGLNIVREKL